MTHDEQRPVTIAELLADWPKDDSGRTCARLVRRFLLSKLVETAADADCNAVSAQAEAAANKALANLAKDFAGLAFPEKAKETPARVIRPLNRFAGPEKTETTKPENK